jgi:AraC-like DNA-binding protein
MGLWRFSLAYVTAVCWLTSSAGPAQQPTSGNGAWLPDLPRQHPWLECPVGYTFPSMTSAEAQNGIAKGLLVEGVATMLAAQLVRNYDARSRPRDDPARRLDPAALRSVMGYMHDHVAEHITLDELSRLAGASRFRFVRLFRASTGMTPMRYLESCRIELARKLLREGNRSMAEIAVAVGFADQSLFVKRFRRHAGCTPGQYATQVGGWTDIRDTVQAALAHTPAQSPAPRHAGE